MAVTEKALFRCAGVSWVLIESSAVANFLVCEVCRPLQAFRLIHCPLYEVVERPSPAQGSEDIPDAQSKRCIHTVCKPFIHC